VKGFGGALAIGLVVLLGLAGLAGFAWWQSQGATHQLKGALKAEDTAITGRAQAQAGQDAQRIVVAGQAHEAIDFTVHQENANAIAKAPGADAPLDPALIATVNAGLRRYGGQGPDPAGPGGLPVQPEHPPGAANAGAIGQPAF